MTPTVESLVLEVLRGMAPRPDPNTPPLLGRDTRLFGRDGLFDSLGLVSFVVAVEQSIEDALGVSVSLADERALSQRHSPYRTVQRLAEYASELVRHAS
jgi:acyl carrier protein